LVRIKHTGTVTNSILAHTRLTMKSQTKNRKIKDNKQESRIESKALFFFLF